MAVMVATGTDRASPGSKVTTGAAAPLFGLVTLIRYDTSTGPSAPPARTLEVWDTVGDRKVTTGLTADILKVPTGP